MQIRQETSLPNVVGLGAPSASTGRDEAKSQFSAVLTLAATEAPDVQSGLATPRPQSTDDAEPNLGLAIAPKEEGAKGGKIVPGTARTLPAEATLRDVSPIAGQSDDKTSEALPLAPRASVLLKDKGSLRQPTKAQLRTSAAIPESVAPREVLSAPVPPRSTARTKISQPGAAQQSPTGRTVEPQAIHPTSIASGELDIEEAPRSSLQPAISDHHKLKGGSSRHGSQAAIPQAASLAHPITASMPATGVEGQGQFVTVSADDGQGRQGPNLSRNASGESADLRRGPADDQKSGETLARTEEHQAAIFTEPKEIAPKRAYSIAHAPATGVEGQGQFVTMPAGDAQDRQDPKLSRNASGESTNLRSGSADDQKSGETLARTDEHQAAIFAEPKGIAPNRAASIAGPEPRLGSVANSGERPPTEPAVQSTANRQTPAPDVQQSKPEILVPHGKEPVTAQPAKAGNDSERATVNDERVPKNVDLQKAVSDQLTTAEVAGTTETQSVNSILPVAAKLSPASDQAASRVAPDLPSNLPKSRDVGSQDNQVRGSETVMVDAEDSKPSHHSRASQPSQNPHHISQHLVQRQSDGIPITLKAAPAVDVSSFGIDLEFEAAGTPAKPIRGHLRASDRLLQAAIRNSHAQASLVVDNLTTPSSNVPAVDLAAATLRGEPTTAASDPGAKQSIQIEATVERLLENRIMNRSARSSVDLPHPDFGKVTLAFSIEGDRRLSVDLPGAPQELRAAMGQALSAASSGESANNRGDRHESQHGTAERGGNTNGASADAQREGSAQRKPGGDSSEALFSKQSASGPEGDGSGVHESHVDRTGPISRRGTFA